MMQKCAEGLLAILGHANPTPACVSWHEYACGTSDSNVHRTLAITYWAQRIAANNQAIQNAIGTTLPIARLACSHS